METSRLLPGDAIHRIFQALLHASIDLETLLQELPPTVRAGVPHASDPGQALYRALAWLNEYRTLEDPQPLQIVLKTAEALCGIRVQAAVVREALSMMDEGVTEATLPEAERRRRTPIVNVVKRMYRLQGFECDPGEHESGNVFVGWRETRARVVGVLLGDLGVTIASVLLQMLPVRQVVASVEGHVVLYNQEPRAEERRMVRDAGLSLVTMGDLQQRALRDSRTRTEGIAQQVLRRQIAWSVEDCARRGESREREALTDLTFERLKGLCSSVQRGDIEHVLLRVDPGTSLGIARSALLTAWAAMREGGRGRWPLQLLVDPPVPLDADELFDRSRSVQKIALESSMADSLFADEDTVPVLACSTDPRAPEVERIVHAVLARKQRGAMLLLHRGEGELGGALDLGASGARTMVFPGDFLGA